ncbi:UbiA family prenyltransferase [Salibacteraceae bacterium]|jgi:4-hydroxybenzoate polyprenyltransferase|nr:UbiA family prenyltransferase [Salibacteraceae bacterium]MDB9709046.1 UbiA family prenyltransferase [Salibacteraceae bacterium]MDC1304418.1 UbiA family prenyltransferase [Salibacteraceae bacterium]
MAKHSSRDNSSTQISTSSEKDRAWRNALILMRIPFSVFLMPVFWFALSNSNQDFNHWTAFAVFIIIHVFMYPASNGYNSYHDKDEESIGGLENPPLVNQELFYLVMLFDATAIIGAYLISPLFAAMVFVYTMVSKAYSFDKIRLKRYPIASTVVVTVFQGAFTYGMVLIALGLPIDKTQMIYAAISTFLIAGSYPLTQIYQHKEDRERGDKTLSLKLGIKGTFIFSSFMFLLGFSGIVASYFMENKVVDIAVLIIATAPIGFYFFRWMVRSWKDDDHINFRNTMNMNAISSIALSLAFITMLVLHHFNFIY